ncbi:hypothetical protein TNCV_5015951 [Trichonephila clavipes]|nr:hypothetical protein TNCV_5015951 [Trichonephila clavipes]
MIGPLPYHHLIEHLLDVLENSGYGVVRTFGSSVSELVLQPSGMVSGSWLALSSSCPVPLKTPPCRGEMNAKFVESSNVLPIDVVARRRMPAQVSPTSLDHGSKLRGASPKALV